ncbi:MAG: right-handed parallel beta-helix repeat-containing protein [Candidatus Heimdallarchaeum aukensis]|uniref:Right-handed parallel beta-helix repeat-containing protein n=1 Tax=Candidatus Heimdallarchaeum aukensis TaxID=2876573 RepID=A0A9Y1BM03_9ARCH|nr:MAG: right-handed parallel beta-helix repeat-containing protein [Candidatus Heimdallarchaeum aukensis]
MKKRTNIKKINFILFLIFVLFASFAIEHVTIKASDSTNIGNQKHFVDDNAEILIISDNDFVKYGFPGDGSVDNPYIISNLDLNTSKMFGIFISNVSSYFVIENCFIRSSYYGISVSGLEENRATIRNNTFYKSIVAVEISHSPGITIINNNFTENRDYGIFIEYSPDSVLNSNYFFKNGVGYSGNGLIIKESENSTITNNSFVRDGLAIEPSNFDIKLSLFNNTVNNKLIGYFTKQNNIVVDQSIYGQILIIECSNVFISNQTISETNVAISVYNSNSILISNNTLMSNDKGIFLFQTYDFAIERNFLENNSLNGLEINDCTKFNIVDNEIINNRKGIELFIVDGYSISNINKNTIKENLEEGLSLNTVNNLNISENFIYKNLVGIYAYYSSNVYIVANSFEVNYLYAITLMESVNNFYIYYNLFATNNLENKNESQCLDNGVNNLWYNPDTEKGNYWTDLNDQKVYSIGGSAGSIDAYPMDPFIVDYPPLFNWQLYLILPLTLTTLLSAGAYFLIKKRERRNSNLSDYKKELKKEKEWASAITEKKDKVGSPISNLNKQIRKHLVKNFSKWFIVGSISVLVISSGFLAYKLSVSPDNTNQNGAMVKYAQALQQSIPEAVYIEIIGNATSAIHESLMDAHIYRISPYPDLTWEVTANILKFDDEGRAYLEEISFTLDSYVIDEIGQNLFESLNNTVILGHYGEKPYNDEDTYNINIKWGLRFFLENTTIIELIVLENGLVVYAKGYWVTFSNYSTNMIGALIIGPESAFDNTIRILREIFEENIN